MWPFGPNVRGMEASRDVEGLAGAASRGPTRMRVAALKALGRIGPAAASALQIALARSDRPAVAAAAARALGQAGDLSCVGQLTAFFRVESDDGVRRAVVEALGRIRGPAALRVLVDALGHYSASVAVAAETALRAGGDEEAIRVLTTEPWSADAKARLAAVKALSRIGARAPSALEALLRRRGSPCDIRVAAVRELGEIGGEAARQALCAVLTDCDWPVSKAAAEVLSRMGGAEAEHPVVRAYRAVAESDWRQAFSLGDAAVGPLQAAVSGGHATTKDGLAAIAILRDLATPNAIRALCAALDDACTKGSGRPVREALVTALYASGGAQDAGIRARLAAEDTAREIPANGGPAVRSGSRFCDRCAASLEWWSRASLNTSGLYSGDFGPGRMPADYAGVCKKCRDGFCSRHADGSKCPKCGGALS